MVRLFRGPIRPTRGRGVVRPHFMNPRQMHPPHFDPRFVNSMAGGRMMRGHSVRPGPPRPPLPLGLPLRGAPRMLPPMPPSLPPRPFYPTDIRPPMHIPGPPRLPPLRHMPPRPMLPVPPIRTPGPLIGRNAFPPVGLFRGRGGRGRGLNRGIGLKRLGSSANGHVIQKKAQKRKEKTEEMEVNKPWVTEALKLEIQKKYQLYKIAKEKKNDNNWQIYKDQRILVGKMTSTAKLEYIGSHPDVDVDQIMFGTTAKG